ncbi:sugar ABC transporter ATP-binding protein [Thermomonospora cellulosilytica]|uniref:Simple sugar transport system ATP-binding protein n=1 Tax=Thermomonospora cellulosilytica TaxID=1411118 RepID=A0A7W3N0I3_9ACTN|nr:sugar ABC transporter ATP-binding protein [Thermomonospora cellulosilytica]MBA9005290.1 simple sugar transport system ATP-binding protein [Thermomonospora cellulosilytica]
MAVPVLEMRGVSKGFPGVQALDDVAFRLFPGEVHALMGENGAGKSTLIKVLTGVYAADAGTVLIDGVRTVVRGPLHARQAGISTVYQEVNLCPNLSVAENIFIGREPRRFGRIDWPQVRRRSAELLSRLDLDVDVNAPLGSYSLAVQQLVAIVRAVDLKAKVLILDEPTSSLDRGEVARLFAVMRRLREDGVAILFVSHFLDQIYEICDRVTVLRNGRLVGEYPIAELSRFELVAKMTGQELQALEELDEAAPRVERGERLFALEGVGRSGAIEPVDLDLHEGEVVGLAGLLGSGRSELARLIFGADGADSGRIHAGTEVVTLKSPRAAIERGIAFCPEDRKGDGLIMDLTVEENIILALQAARGWTRPLSRRRREELAAEYIRALRIHPPHPHTPVRNLSGGNQQKVLLARWLITRPKLLILDEPTRGIDIGAKTEIQKLVVSLAGDGMGVLFISAELEEVLRISHKIEVLRDRRLVAELGNDGTLTPERILQTIANGAADS